MLHGCWAQKQPEHIDEYIANYKRLAEEANVVVLLPISQEHSWDFIVSQLTRHTDLDFIQACLNEVRSRMAIDDRRIAIMGYSDGASFGLSIALHNPDIFQAAMLWATGFCVQPQEGAVMPGRPRLFMWHGTEDQVFDFKSQALPLWQRLADSGWSVQGHAEEGGRHKGPSVDSDFMKACLHFWSSTPT